MGWTIKIEAEREIDTDVMAAAISAMPDKFLGDFRSQPPQHWGWPLKIQVPNPVGNNVTLDGSYGQSASIATEFADALVATMCKHGLQAGIVFNDLNH